jgi:oligopeptide/dipeptide ABC transporter ATP-binding protein
MNAVEVDNLTVIYDVGGVPVRAVRNASLTIAQGETLAVVGESGSGKSTLARALVGLLPRSGRIGSGEVRIAGMPVTRMSETELESIRGSKVGFVFQDPDTYLNPVFSIGRQVADVIALHQRVPAKRAWELAIEQLARVDIQNLAAVMKAYPHQLSGGMRQRVLMAMATSCSPALLIADEPTTALDVLVQRQVLLTLKRLKSEVGMAVLLVTHDLGLVAEYADRVAVMYGGTLVEVQPATRLFRHPRHPYTAGLIAAALPAANRRFATLAGSPPDLRSLNAGCPFQPRCDRALDTCVNEMPALINAGDAAFACWNPRP